MKVTQLRCEYLDNPIGIDILHPRLSWNVEGICVQKSFEIQYSVNGKEMPPIRMESSSMSFVFPYQNQSRDIVRWKVRVYDETGVYSPFSEEAGFTYGLLNPEDFSASWISGDYKGKKNRRYPVDVFYTEFEMSDLKEAMLYVSALGLYEFYLNGKKVGKYLLAPGFTDYRVRAMYDTYDVRTYLKPGKNTIHVLLADGWYRGSIGAKGFTCVYGKETKLLFQLEMTSSDGRKKTVFSDGHVLWSDSSPLRFADLKDGETVDWNFTPDFKRHAKVSRYDGILSSGNNVHVKEIGSYSPVEEIKISEEKSTYGFLFNMAGSVSFSCQAKKGDRIQVVLGEILDEKKEVSLNNIQCIHKGKKSPLQRIEYICKEGKNEYRSRFFYGGFRYATVCLTSGVRDFSIQAVQISSKMEETSSFHCSNELINVFYQNALNSLKSNSVDIPTDCPTRERMGWTGDSQVFFNSASYLLDYAAFTRKHLRDVFDRQRKDGCLPQIAPYSHEDWYMDVMNGSVGWADVGVLTPYRMYLRYQDKRILEDYYPNMVRYAKFMISRCGRAKGIYKIYAKHLHLSKENRKYQVNTGQSYGEWAEPEDVKSFQWTDFACPHPEESMAYTVLVMDTMMKISNILDKKEDIPLFEEYRDGVKKAYQELVSKEADSLDTDRQAKLVRPLYLSLLDENQKEFAKKRLIQAMEHYDWRIGTGFLSTPFILYVLADIDPKYAYKLLLNEKNPGWLYMARHSTGSIWESWEGETGQKGIASLNHYSKGAMVEWLFSSMLGIRVEKENRFLIKPVLDPSVESASGSYRSIYGKISVSYCFLEDLKSVRFEIDVPGNTKALFRIGKEEKILPSGHHCFENQF